MSPKLWELGLMIRNFELHNNFPNTRVTPSKGLIIVRNLETYWQNISCPTGRKLTFKHISLIIVTTHTSEYKKVVAICNWCRTIHVMKYNLEFILYSGAYFQSTFKKKLGLVIMMNLAVIIFTRF